MSPSSTVMLPGPTCFQPVRSLPLKSGFQAGGCDCAAANASRAEAAASVSIVADLRGFMASCSSQIRLSRGARHGRLRPYRANSELQILKIVVTDFNVIEGGLGLVVFDEIMFDTGFFGVREDALPINRALADIGEAPANFHRRAGGALVGIRGVGVLDPVFYVDERETAGIFFKISERIFAGDANPAEIQLHGDELGIRLGEEEIVREFAAERIGRNEFERVIVIAELDAGFFAGFAGFVEEVGGALPAAGFGALLFVNPGANDIVVADDLGGFESFRPLFFDDVIADVAGRRGQAILVEDGADVFRRMIEIPGEFDLLVTGGGDFRDGAFEVGLHGLAHGVELEADAVNGMRDRRAVDVMCGVRSPGWLGGRCESRSDGRADKSSSIHGRHSTPVERNGNRESAEKRKGSALKGASLLEFTVHVRIGTSPRPA